MMPAPRVLIVDDQIDSLKWLYEVLTQNGYKTLLANSGELALQSIARVQPDLLLLDVSMPGMDGFELCRRVKADPATRDIPVIFLSAADAEAKLEAFRAGGVDFVPKPFSEAEVLARVAAQWDLRRLRLGLKEQIAERTEELHQALKDKDLLMRELQHRVKNHLTLVTGLLTLTEATSADEPAGEVLEKARCRVQALASVYDLLYRSDEHETVDVSGYVERLLNPWRDNLPAGITLEQRVLAVPLPTTQLIPLGLIITELVTNALKYAFPAQRVGRILVVLERQGDNLKLSVSDNGVGTSTTGEHHGLGWELIESLSHQLKGGWSTCSDQGICVEVWFAGPRALAPL
ncbi:MAG: response regulator [Spirochaetales bacterium]